MDNKNTATQEKLGVMPQQMVATQPGNQPSPSVKVPDGPGVCITGFAGQGVYRIVQCYNLKNMTDYLQARTPFPLEIPAWLPVSDFESKRQGDHLRRLFRDKRTGDGLFRLSARDLAEAQAYLDEESKHLAREAGYARLERARKLKQKRQDAAKAQQEAAKARENAIDECLQLINRVRMMAEVVRMSLEQERGVARRTWPQQQATDECLKLVDRFHGVASKFDMALSRSAMEIQLARTPKGDAALSMM